MVKVSKANHNFRKFFTTTIAMVVVSIISISGCGDSGTESGARQTSTITEQDGGSFSFGDVYLDFPPGSVDDFITVGGWVVSDVSPPEGVTALTDIYYFNISDVDRYIADTATLKFTLDEDVMDGTIYHSEDGIDWENLVGDVSGKEISINVYRFSHFFVGRIKNGPIQYEVQIKNNSMNTTYICLFQTNDNNPNETMSLAWMSRYTYSGTSTWFSWRGMHVFTWGGYGLLQPGTIFRCSQTVSTAYLQNAITLTRKNGAFNFENITSGPLKHLFYIKQDNKIPANKISTGIGLNHSSAYVVQAQPNVTSTFGSNYHSKYWITFGDYRQGQVLDTDSIFNKVQIIFPSGVLKRKVVLNPDNTLTVLPVENK